MSTFARIGTALSIVVGVGFLSGLAWSRPDTKPRLFALLVGVNDYDHADLAKLEYAVNDVTILRDVLVKAGYEVILLTAEEGQRDRGRVPTKANVEAQLKEVARRFTKGDTLLIGLAGHGLQFGGDEDSYFCPVDARPFKERAETLVSVKWIYDRLQKDMATGAKLLLVDACRNDPTPGRGRGIDADNAPPPPRGVGVLLSCSAGQRSFERGTYRHGVFFHHVLQGLQGEAQDRSGNVTWDSLRSYVKEQVARDEKLQSPEETGRLSGASPLLVSMKDKSDTTDVGKTERVAPLGMKFVKLSKGTFYMGGGDGTAGTKTAIKEDFEIAIHTVTQSQWQALMNDNPSFFSRTGGGKDTVADFTVADLKQFPVESVSWDDAQKFIEKLNEKERGSGYQYRLPTEAEWEYACRGGATSSEECSYHFYLAKPTNDLSSDQANFHGEYPFGNASKGLYLGRSAKVGSYAPNKLGLHDMHGNVWQWCADFDEGAASRVMRGGGWSNDGRNCQAAFRFTDGPSRRFNDLGLRLVRVPVRSPEETGRLSGASPPLLSVKDKADTADPGKTELAKDFVNSVNMKMVYMKPGTFRMGSPANQHRRQDDETQHTVTLTKGFHLGATLVTQKQWKAVMGNNPSMFQPLHQTQWEKSRSSDDLPVERVTWHDAKEFCKKLSAREGQSYRLPYEAEWEYACRAGTTTPFWFGETITADQGNYHSNYPFRESDPGGRYRNETTPVKEFKPNPWGLHDMHGNVYQWCEDWYGRDYYAHSQPKDPHGPTTGAQRVLRGGCWNMNAACSVATSRFGLEPAGGNGTIGFRVARGPVR